MHLPVPVRCVFAVIAAGLLLCLHPQNAEAAYVNGVTATTTMGSGFGTNLQNTVNGVGLSSQSLTATHAGTAPDNSWVSAGTVLAGSVTFDLHASLVITGFSVWNQNGGGPGASGITGIRNVTVSYSTDGVTFQPVPGAPPQFNQVSAMSNAPPQIVTFPGVLATHIRFQILSNYGDAGQTGFAEVAFDGNQPPTITAPETITTAEDIAANFTVTVVDAEGDPDEPPIPVFSTPAKGTITGTRTNFTYTPSPNANGTDSFTITAEDPLGERTMRTVNVTITPVNDAPVFASVPESLMTNEDAALSFNVAASDLEGDTVTLTSTNGEKGVVSGNGASFIYTPNANAHGSDSFTLTASDGNGGMTSATVSVTITPVNDAPVFTSVPETLMMNEDTAANFNVAASDLDGDAVTLSFLGATRGTVSAGGESHTYTPNLHANGTDSFTITASDGNGGTVTATVTVTIAPVNDAPVFTSLPPTLTTDEDKGVNFNVTSSDADGDAVTINAANGQKGIVSGSGSNFVYTPNADANGSDSFTVTASDGNGGAISAEVTVTITPLNDPPIFTSIPTKLTTDKEAAVAFDVTTSDVEGDPVSVTFTGAIKGIISGSGPSYTYTPNPGAAGIDRITASADDGQGGITTAIVKVTIVAYPARYAMLLEDANGVHSFLTLKLSVRGSLTGAVRDANNKRVPFRGTVPPPGATSTTLNLKDGSSLVLEFDTRSRVNARLTTTGRMPTGSGDIALIPPGTIPGRYTMVFDTGSGGFGWCLMTVDKRGGVRFSGKLPDGSAMLASQGTLIDGENQAPVFLPGKSHGTTALLSGVLHFAEQPESDVNGALAFRAGGADSTCEALGAHFTKGRSALPPGSYPLAFSGEGVNISSNVTLNSDNTATVENPLISLTPGGGVGRPANGLFSVQFRENGTGRSGSRAPTLRGTGVFVQKHARGFGQFFKNGVTGQVLIGEQP